MGESEEKAPESVRKNQTEGENRRAGIALSGDAERNHPSARRTGRFEFAEQGRADRKLGGDSFPFRRKVRIGDLVGR